MFQILSIEQKVHAATKERFLYAQILMGGNDLCPYRHALVRYHAIGEVLEDRQAAPSSSAGWLARVKTLSSRSYHHLKEKEKKFFQASGKLLAESQTLRLAPQYRCDFTRMKKQLAA